MSWSWSAIRLSCRGTGVVEQPAIRARRREGVCEFRGIHVTSANEPLQLTSYWRRYSARANADSRTARRLAVVRINHSVRLALMPPRKYSSDHDSRENVNSSLGSRARPNGLKPIFQEGGKCMNSLEPLDSNVAVARRRRYLTSAQVRERYGGKSAMWIWRRLKYDPRFPKPLKISGRQYFDEEALDRFDHACARM
jgi:predicted DNA-binding transcriptional regulator AlpA